MIENRQRPGRRMPASGPPSLQWTSDHTAPSRYRAVAMRHADHPVLDDRDLPGPLSIDALCGYGAVTRLDSTNAYQRERAGTLYGRSTIMAGLAPRSTTICACSAAWLWMGGAFPQVIDVISRSHYRTSIHERPIRVFNRKCPAEQTTCIGEVRTTIPVRTVCDLAMLPEHEEGDERIDALIGDLMARYRVTPDDCLAILDDNPFWPRAAAARELFRGLNRL